MPEIPGAVSTGQPEAANGANDLTIATSLAQHAESLPGMAGQGIADLSVAASLAQHAKDRGGLTSSL